MRSDRYYAPFNKVVIEVPYDIYINFDQVVFEKCDKYSLRGDSCVNSTRCFYIVQEEYKWGRPTYKITGEYTIFTRALAQFNKLVNDKILHTNK